HELRTPLNVILGFSDLLMSDAEIMDAPRVAERSQHINSSALRLYRLIENFLIYAHTEILLTDTAQMEFLKRSYVVYPKSTIVNTAQQRLTQQERDEDLQTDVHGVE